MLKVFHVCSVLELQDENQSTDVEAQEEVVETVSKEFLDEWFSKTVLSYRSGRTLTKTELSEREYNFIQSNSVMSGVDVCYMLLEKHLGFNFEAQLQCVLSVIRFLEQCRLPKSFMGGFMILMVKYHFLPV